VKVASSVGVTDGSSVGVRVGKGVAVPVGVTVGEGGGALVSGLALSGCLWITAVGVEGVVDEQATRRAIKPWERIIV
jgi:hypothetical protein